MRIGIILAATVAFFLASPAMANGLCKTNTYDGGTTVIGQTTVQSHKTPNSLFDVQCGPAGTCVPESIIEQVPTDIVVDNPDILKHQDLNKPATVVATLYWTIKNGTYTYTPVWKPEQAGACS